MDDSSAEKWRLADEEMRKNLPPGMKLVRTLRGHTNWIGQIAWSPYGRMLASPSGDKTIRLWDVETGECLKTLEGHQDAVSSVAFDPAGSTLASGSEDGSIKLWEPASGKLLRTLKGHQEAVFSVAFDPADSTLASGSYDTTIKLWDSTSGRLLRTLEGHIYAVVGVSFSSNGSIVASKGTTSCSTVRLWHTKTGSCIGIITELAFGNLSDPVFCPCMPLLATVGSDPKTLPDESDRVIHIYELDFAVLLDQTASEPTVSYTSAKVVLVGDSGVGKTGLGWRLAHEEFKEHSSTHGQQFWLLNQLCKQRGDGAQCEAVENFAGRIAYPACSGAA
jgi:WD40 repeat protein